MIDGVYWSRQNPVRGYVLKVVVDRCGELLHSQLSRLWFYDIDGVYWSRQNPVRGYVLKVVVVWRSLWYMIDGVYWSR